MKIESQFKNGDCDQENIIAKCVVKSIAVKA
jgi:hypothetical protein